MRPGPSLLARLPLARVRGTVDTLVLYVGLTAVVVGVGFWLLGTFHFLPLALAHAGAHWGEVSLLSGDMVVAGRELTHKLLFRPREGHRTPRRPRRRTFPNW